MTLAIIDGDVFLYLAMWGSDTLDDAKEKFKSILEDNLASVFATDYAMAFGGPGNFRADLYLDYKQSTSRKKSSSKKPDWFDELKSYGASFPGSHLCVGYEADDQVRIWALEADKAGVNRVVITVDKDLDCIPGNHYNPRKKEIYQIDEDYAEWFYWKQVLMGDSVDNIPGIRGCGPVRAEKILAGSSTHADYRDSVCRAYHDAYGKEGYEYLITNGRLIHIWRHMDDHFKISREKYDNAIE